MAYICMQIVPSLIMHYCTDCYIVQYTCEMIHTRRNNGYMCTTMASAWLFSYDIRSAPEYCEFENQITPFLFTHAVN